MLRRKVQFDSRWERCIYRASRPSQGTVNWDAISKWPRCWRDVKHKQTTSLLQPIIILGRFHTTQFWAYDDLRWPSRRRRRNVIVKCETICEAVGRDSRKSEGIASHRNVLKMFKISQRLGLKTERHNRVVWEGGSQMVSISVKWHGSLRLSVVTYRIQSDPSLDKNRVVWGLSYLDNVYTNLSNAGLTLHNCELATPCDCLHNDADAVATSYSGKPSAISSVTILKMGRGNRRP